MRRVDHIDKLKGLGKPLRRLSPYSRLHRFGDLDGRTYEARLFGFFRDELTEHCGGAPNTVERALIERAAWLRLRLALLDTKVASGGFTETDSHVYLAWANTLSRLLSKLPAAPASKALTLREYLSSKAQAAE